MLEESDRASSLDLGQPQPPVVGVTTDHQEITEDTAAASGTARADDEFVLSEHFFTKLDQQLSRGQNRPTALFYATLVIEVAHAALFLFGWPLLPGFLDGITGDLTMVAGLICASGGGWGLVGVLFSVNARQAFRTDREGPLILLGAGVLLITKAEDRSLRKAALMGNLYYGSRGLWLYVVILGSVYVWMMVTSDGYPDKRSPVHNVAGTMLLWVWSHSAGAICFSWPLALQLATTLVNSRTNAIRAAIEREHCAPQGAEYWEAAVVQPCMDLVDALEVLNEGFGRGLILQVLTSATMFSSLILILLSEWFSDLTGSQEFAAVLFGGMVSVAMLIPAVQCLMVLGAVSTSCDDMVEDLNKLRLKMYTPEMDARLFMLERALQNMNHGQGIGFSIMGLVLTKKLIFLIFAEFIAGLAFVFPIILSSVAAKFGGVDHTGSELSCGLTEAQERLLEASLLAWYALGSNTSCAYNVTVGSSGATVL